jgi:polyhydroxyalkanoate synthase
MTDTTPPHRHPMDVPLKAALGRLTHGLSPAALALAFQDWWWHLCSSPGKLAELSSSASHGLVRNAVLAQQQLLLQAPGETLQDKRFTHPAWAREPFGTAAKSFLMAQAWWAQATTGVPGVSTHHEQVVSFMARQLLDMLSPSNFVASNPEVIEKTWRTLGDNLRSGMLTWWHEAGLVLADQPPPGAERFRPGEAVALTPGKVVFRNRLIELIQYEPATGTVHPEPLLVVPSWIMKYYILDLSPHNSMVKYLVSQGHTVFMISWRNPDEADRELGMDDYLQLGVMAALEAVQRAQPRRLVHLVGYCLGGTLAAIAAASLGGRGKDSPLKTFTLLAGQTDFKEPGELGLFIDESQIAFLEQVMDEQGYLDGRQMAGAFALINSKDLVWSKLVRVYLMGGTVPLDDLHAWNADATRLPARMHSEYLRGLYLRNDLAEGRYLVQGQPVALSDIRVPMFVVGTERDHVSPWRSVYKIHLLTHTDTTFVLTSGGHNVGIVNPPANDEAAAMRSHRIARRRADQPYLAPDLWFEQTPSRPGSWWTSWHQWLVDHSGARTRPLPLGGNGPERLQPMGDAPGTYVHAA